VGKVSYGIYLWQAAIGVVIWHFGWYRVPADQNLGWVYSFLWLLVPTLLVATMSWFAIERPLIRWSRSVGRRGEPVPDVALPVEPAAEPGTAIA
jgi:peptidoglycan/LPS O-acetylase OafA/YrhL